MSDVEHQLTDILLPSASVCVFSKDADTLKSAGILKDDWRFARVNVDIIESDVDNAIQKFKENGASDLIIIQTDEIDDNFTDKLGELSNYCDEDTAAIIIGPVNDVYLYRKLIEMGVSDYLVRPVQPEIITDVIVKALIKRLGISDSRLIAFIGAKGGVGTSSLTQICANISSETMGQKTLLMDGAGGWSSLSVGMGFDPVTTLPESLRAVESGSEDSLDRMFYDVSDNLRVLASGADTMLDPNIAAKSFETLIDNFMVKSPIVFVDLSSAEASVKKAVLSRAHHIVIITTPTVTSLRFCRSLIKEISDVRGGDSDDVSLIVNQVGISKAHEVSDADISEALEFSSSASIPSSPALFFKYESDMKDMVSDKEYPALVTAFLPILKKTISGGNVENDKETDSSSGILGGFLSKFTSK